jgi:hypothetical protein
VEYRVDCLLSMETATPVAEQAPVQADDAYYRRRPKGEPLFNQEQQEKFDKAFSRRERKLRAEYHGVLTDLFETVGIAEQLLQRCKGLISVEDQVAILDGFQGIRRDWESKWQKQK